MGLNLARVAGVALVPALVFAEFWGFIELLPHDVDDVTALVFVIFQHRPRQRIVVRSHAEEPAEAEHRIGDVHSTRSQLLESYES